MRMLLPGVKLRRSVDERLMRFFHSYQEPDFDSALVDLCAFYGLPKVNVIWFEYIDGGTTLGQTHEDGKTIELIHPEDYKRRSYENSARSWVRTFYHEIAHVILWSDREAKAEKYVRKFVAGLKG